MSNILKSILAVLFLSLGVFVFAEEKADKKPFPKKENFHIYLLMGQSNMAGCGRIEAVDTTPHDRVLMLDKNNKWVPAKEPLHGSGVGPGFSFGKAMAENDKDVVIGLVPCAVGGTQLVRWQKGGDLYAKALARALEAAKSGTLKGVIWHQGESDSATEKDSSTYHDRLTAMFVDFRKDTGADLFFVVGELGEFIVKFKRWPFFGKVNEALNKAAKTDPKCLCVSSANLKDGGDNVHFNAEAEREFGQRFAKGMQQLETAENARNYPHRNPTLPPTDKNFEKFSAKELIPYILNEKRIDEKSEFDTKQTAAACAWFIWKTKETPKERAELVAKIMKTLRKAKSIHDYGWLAGYLGSLEAKKEIVQLIGKEKKFDCCYGPALMDAFAENATVEDIPTLIKMLDKEDEGSSGCVNEVLEKITGVPSKIEPYTPAKARAFWKDWLKNNKKAL